MLQHLLECFLKLALRLPITFRIKTKHLGPAALTALPSSPPSPLPLLFTPSPLPLHPLPILFTPFPNSLHFPLCPVSPHLPLFLTVLTCIGSWDTRFLYCSTCSCLLPEIFFLTLVQTARPPSSIVLLCRGHSPPLHLWQETALLFPCQLWALYLPQSAFVRLE